jgi:hypothetical protein
MTDATEYQISLIYGNRRRIISGDLVRKSVINGNIRAEWVNSNRGNLKHIRDRIINKHF